MEPRIRVRRAVGVPNERVVVGTRRRRRRSHVHRDTGHASRLESIMEVVGQSNGPTVTVGVAALVVDAGVRHRDDESRVATTAAPAFRVHEVLPVLLTVVQAVVVRVHVTRVVDRETLLERVDQEVVVAVAVQDVDVAVGLVVVAGRVALVNVTDPVVVAVDVHRIHDAVVVTVVKRLDLVRNVVDAGEQADVVVVPVHVGVEHRRVGPVSDAVVLGTVQRAVAIRVGLGVRIAPLLVLDVVGHAVHVGVGVVRIRRVGAVVAERVEVTRAGPRGDASVVLVVVVQVVVVRVPVLRVGLAGTADVLTVQVQVLFVVVEAVEVTVDEARIRLGRRVLVTGAERAGIGVGTDRARIVAYLETVDETVTVGVHVALVGVIRALVAVVDAVVVGVAVLRIGLRRVARGVAAGRVHGAVGILVLLVIRQAVVVHVEVRRIVAPKVLGVVAHAVTVGVVVVRVRDVPVGAQRALLEVIDVVVRRDAEIGLGVLRLGTGRPELSDRVGLEPHVRPRRLAPGRLELLQRRVDLIAVREAVAVEVYHGPHRAGRGPLDDHLLDVPQTVAVGVDGSVRNGAVVARVERVGASRDLGEVRVPVTVGVRVARVQRLIVHEVAPLATLGLHRRDEVPVGVLGAIVEVVVLVSVARAVLLAPVRVRVEDVREPIRDQLGIDRALVEGPSRIVTRGIEVMTRDRDAVLEAVTIGVGVERVRRGRPHVRRPRLPPVDLGPVHHAVVVAVRVERVGAVCKRLFAVLETVVVAVCIVRVGTPDVDLFAVAQTVVVGVVVVRVGLVSGLIAVPDTVAVGVAVESVHARVGPRSAVAGIGIEVGLVGTRGRPLDKTVAVGIGIEEVSLVREDFVARSNRIAVVLGRVRVRASDPNLEAVRQAIAVAVRVVGVSLVVGAALVHPVPVVPGAHSVTVEIFVLVIESVVVAVPIERVDQAVTIGVTTGERIERVEARERILDVVVDAVAVAVDVLRIGLEPGLLPAVRPAVAVRILSDQRVGQVGVDLVAVGVPVVVSVVVVRVRVDASCGLVLIDETVVVAVVVNGVVHAVPVGVVVHDVVGVTVAVLDRRLRALVQLLAVGVVVVIRVVVEEVRSPDAELVAVRDAVFVGVVGLGNIYRVVSPAVRMLADERNLEPVEEPIVICISDQPVQLVRADAFPDAVTISIADLDKLLDVVVEHVVVAVDVEGVHQTVAVRVRIDALGPRSRDSELDAVRQTIAVGVPVVRIGLADIHDAVLIRILVGIVDQVTVPVCSLVSDAVRRKQTVLDLIEVRQPVTVGVVVVRTGGDRRDRQRENDQYRSERKHCASVTAVLSCHPTTS